MNKLTSYLEAAREFLKKPLRWLWKAWVVVTSAIGSIVLGFVLLLVVIVAASGDDSSVQSQTVSKKELREGSGGVVAVVDMTGVIVENPAESDPFTASSALVASNRVVPLLATLAADDDVKAVVLRVNSPGGTVVASDDIYRAVRALREEKPVVTSMGDVAASGGYYIAAGGSKIVANPATITGSIGVIAQFPQLSGLYDKLGVEMRTIKSGTFKDIGSADRDMTDEERAIIDSIITENYQQFVAAIVDGRGMEPAQVIRLADGRIYSGRQAKENGLVDELGGLYEAIDIAEELAGIDDARVLEYGSRSFFETLFEAKFNVGPFKVVESLVPQQKFGVYYLMDV